ncbi:N-acetyltransferase ESCO2-like protein [Dinothrombium tinctorium]|uniref:N-acetyltransferase ESCO2-like protein n=1 Tax=Dinothrombium tinctorium TaxID=1965070 RepID=A0A3S4R1P8_9ACAR|nr:N-acetyltransferase ESCO2-like protein [Dinothrombium tinctorium]RWS10471.1 N-acetyltransferase ESCO2-like protein [Dinothrombium tinctorium]
MAKRRSSRKRSKHESSVENDSALDLDFSRTIDENSERSPSKRLKSAANELNSSKQNDVSMLSSHSTLTTPESVIKKQLRLYPIFERKVSESGRKSNSSPNGSSTRKSTRRRVPLLKSNDQYAIDAGQRDFDASRCKMCNMLYTVGEITDEKHHADYHDMFVNGLRFSGWKKERVYKYLDDGSRVIAVLSKDPKFMLKKLDDLFKIADLELNINVNIQSSVRDSSLYLIYVTLDGRIAGFVAAEGIQEASQLVAEDSMTVSTESVPATCGVSRLWVHPNYRRQGIATVLLDVLRANFLKDSIIKREDLAFSDPTVNGKDFAKKYTGKSRFLIYQYQLPNINLFSRV